MEFLASVVGSQIIQIFINLIMNPTLYESDTSSLTRDPRPIIFGGQEGKYLSNKTIDRFVWVVVFFVVVPSNDNYYVDAKTGEVTGIWNPCPQCVCHHGKK